MAISGNSLCHVIEERLIHSIDDPVKDAEPEETGST